MTNKVDLVVPTAASVHDWVRAKSVSDALCKQFDGDEVLHHGTRFSSAIMKSNTLKRHGQDMSAVSFSRCPFVAASYALLPKEYDDGFGVIISVSRRLLTENYRLEQRSRVYPPRQHFMPFEDELEECITEKNIRNLKKYVLSYSMIMDSGWTMFDDHYIKPSLYPIYLVRQEDKIPLKLEETEFYKICANVLKVPGLQ